MQLEYLHTVVPVADLVKGAYSVLVGACPSPALFYIILLIWESMRLWLLKLDWGSQCV